MAGALLQPREHRPQRAYLLFSDPVEKESFDRANVQVAESLKARGENAPQVELVPMLGDPFSQITSFPAGSIGMITWTWPCGLEDFPNVMGRCLGALRPGGGFGLLCNAANSPSFPFHELRRQARKLAGLDLKFPGLPFPKDETALRKILAKAGFNDARAWVEEVTFMFDSPDAVLKHMRETSGGMFIPPGANLKTQMGLERACTAAIEAGCRRCDDYALVYTLLATAAFKPIED
jgi:hypothetical protein